MIPESYNIVKYSSVTFRAYAFCFGEHARPVNGRATSTKPLRGLPTPLVSRNSQPRRGFAVVARPFTAGRPARAKRLQTPNSGG